MICGDCSDDGKPSVGCGVATVEVGPPEERVLCEARALLVGVRLWRSVPR